MEQSEFFNKMYHTKVVVFKRGHPMVTLKWS